MADLGGKVWTIWIDFAMHRFNRYWKFLAERNRRILSSRYLATCGVHRTNSGLYSYEGHVPGSTVTCATKGRRFPIVIQRLNLAQDSRFKRIRRTVPDELWAILIVGENVQFVITWDTSVELLLGNTWLPCDVTAVMFVVKSKKVSLCWEIKYYRENSTKRNCIVLTTNMATCCVIANQLHRHFFNNWHFFIQKLLSLIHFLPVVIGRQLFKLCGHYGLFLGVQLRNFAQICATRVLCLPVIFCGYRGRNSGVGGVESDNNLVQDFPGSWARLYNIIFTILYDSVGSCLVSFMGRTLYHLVQDLDQNPGHDFHQGIIIINILHCKWERWDINWDNMSSDRHM